jgi:putative DNA primase/helicase
VTRTPARENRPKTDLGNAERLVDQHGADLRYIYGERKWLIWDCTRWRRDDTGEIERRAIETAKAIGDEARAMPRRTDAQKTAAEAMHKHATASQFAARLRAMVDIGRSAVAARPDAFDADPWLLNTAGGTVDLRSGELRPSVREDLLTKLAGVDVGLADACPRWRSFVLESVGGDIERANFLQRAAGYAATGLRQERLLVVLLGPTGTGKSTMLDTLRLALGEYADVTPMSTLLGAALGGSNSNDVAALKGKRLVIASEADDSRAWDGVKVKLLTGNDALSARLLYSEFATFMPTHHIWISTNALPGVVRPGDDAFFERLRIVQFAPARGPRDLTLPSILQAELPAILGWIIEGATLWQRDGLAPTAAMRDALLAYRDGIDPVSAWLRECADLSDPMAQSHVRPVYDAYCRWSAEAHEPPMGEHAFGSRLIDAGATRRKSTNGERRWLGLRLKSGVGGVGPGVPVDLGMIRQQRREAEKAATSATSATTGGHIAGLQKSA